VAGNHLSHSAQGDVLIREPLLAPAAETGGAKQLQPARMPIFLKPLAQGVVKLLWIGQDQERVYAYAVPVFYEFNRFPGGRYLEHNRLLSWANRPGLNSAYAKKAAGWPIAGQIAKAVFLQRNCAASPFHDLCTY
jgi:hypothetical protein